MKKTVIMKTIAVAGLMMAVSAFPVLAQSNTDTQALLNRLNQIDNQMQTLTRHVYKGDVPPPTFDAPSSNTNAVIGTFEARVGDMEEQIRSLTGQVEKLQYDLSRTTERLDAFEARAAQALQAPSQRAMGGQMGGQGSSPALLDRSQVSDENVDPFNNPKNALPVGTDATSSYEYAYSLLKDSDYAGAEDAFSAFISQYPNDRLTTNARYWLAETFYVRGNFEAAAIRFAEAYQKDQKGPKAADNLLKLGMSLGGLGKKDDACLSFKELDKRFPDASASVKQRATQQKSTLGCV